MPSNNQSTSGMSHADVFEAARKAYHSGDEKAAKVLLDNIPLETRKQMHKEYLLEWSQRQEARQRVERMGMGERILEGASLMAGKAALGISDLISGDSDTLPPPPPEPSFTEKETEEEEPVPSNVQPSFIEELLGLPTTIEERASTGKWFQARNDALWDNAPVSAAFGNFLGATVVAAPAIMAAEATPLVGGASMAARTLPLVRNAPTVARAATATAARAPAAAAAGYGEGYLYQPWEGETRESNAQMTAAFAVAGEAIGNAISAYRAARSAGMLDAGKYDNISEALSEQGIDINNLRPETQDFLTSLRGDFDVDKAIEGAMQTEFGFKLTAGEASRDFTQLSTEETAARMSQEAGDRLRQFKVEQNRDITASAGRLAEEAGGDVALSREGVGASIKTAMSEVQQGQKDAYDALYTGLRDMAEQSGFDIELPTTNVQQTFDQMVRDHGSEYEGFLTDIGRRFQDYGIFEADRFAPSRLLEATGVERKPLTLTNKEDLVKYLNSLYTEDPVRQRVIGQLKEALDDTADMAVADYEGLSDEALRLAGVDPAAGRAFLQQAAEARSAFREYKGMWEGRNVIQDIVDFKPGTETPRLDPSAVAGAVIRSPENVNRVVSTLAANGQQQAVDDLRTFVMKDMFEQAVNVNNVDVAGEGVFSGSKLSSYIKKNNDALQALLTPDQFSRLKGFEEQVGKATKRPAGTVNTSNTAYKVIDFLFKQFGLGKIPGLSLIPERTARGTVSRATVDTAAEALKTDNVFHPRLNALIRQTLSTFENAPEGQELLYMETGPSGEQYPVYGDPGSRGQLYSAEPRQ